METDFRRPARVAFATGFLLAVAVGAEPALGQDWTSSADWKASGYLRGEHLQEAGLHFVPDMGTIRLLFDHQDNLTTHQEFVVEWDSIPGQTKIMRYDDAERIPASPKFVVKERKQNVSGRIGNKEDKVIHSLVIVAVDRRKQILGIWVTPDPRLIYGESAGLLIQPNVTLRFWMPDDAQIKSIVIFRAIPREEGGAKLLQAGAIDLAPDSGFRRPPPGQTEAAADAGAKGGLKGTDAFSRCAGGIGRNCVWSGPLLGPRCALTRLARFRRVSTGLTLWATF